MSIKLIKTNDPKILLKESTTKDFITRADSVALSLNDLSKAVVFTTAMPSTSYVVVAVLENTDDSNPDNIPVSITAKATTGFTASWPTPLDSANYKLNWILSEVHSP